MGDHQPSAAIPGLESVKMEQRDQEMPDSGLDYEVPKLPEPPAFRPTSEEFMDPMKYLESIREEAEKFGESKPQLAKHSTSATLDGA